MVIVFGSINVDLVFRIHKLPRVGETQLCDNYSVLPGGKGANQAIAAAKAGSFVKMFGCVGKDNFSEVALQTFHKENIAVETIRRVDQPTGCASISVTPDGENVITVASGANMDLKADDVPEDVLTKDNTLVLQMEVNTEETWKIVRRAAEKDMKIVLNLAPAYQVPEDVMRSLSVLILNEVEASMLALKLNLDIIYPTVAARKIASSFGISCIVTLGSEGAYACTPGQAWKIKGMQIKAVDTTSAGDTFVGYFASFFDRGLAFEEALRKATVASGLTCLTHGSQPSIPSHQEVDKSLSKVSPARRTA